MLPPRYLPSAVALARTALLSPPGLPDELRAEIADELSAEIADGNGEGGGGEGVGGEGGGGEGGGEGEGKLMQ